MIEAGKDFFGEDALQYVVVVFTKCSKEHTKSPENFRMHWNNGIRRLVNSVGNRWSISPDPDVFSPGDPNFERHLEGLRKHILSTFEIYPIKSFEDYRAEMMRAKKKEEEDRKRDGDKISELTMTVEIKEKQIKDLCEELVKTKKLCEELEETKNLKESESRSWWCCIL